MIITGLLTIFLAIVIGLFGVLPSIPATPASIETVGDSLIAFVGNGTSFLALIFTPALLTAAVVVILGLFFFTKVYFLTLWIIKKIPILNIK